MSKELNKLITNALSKHSSKGIETAAKSKPTVFISHKQGGGLIKAFDLYTENKEKNREKIDSLLSFIGVKHGESVTPLDLSYLIQMKKFYEK